MRKVISNFSCVVLGPKTIILSQTTNVCSATASEQSGHESKSSHTSLRSFRSATRDYFSRGTKGIKIHRKLVTSIRKPFITSVVLQLIINVAQDRMTFQTRLVRSHAESHLRYCHEIFVAVASNYLTRFFTFVFDKRYSHRSRNSLAFLYFFYRRLLGCETAFLPSKH